MPVTCLLDRSCTYPSLSDLLDALQQAEYGIDLEQLCSAVEDEVELAQAINYLRAKLTLPEAGEKADPGKVFAEIMQQKKHVNEEFLQPGLEGDSLLFLLLDRFDVGEYLGNPNHREGQGESGKGQGQEEAAEMTMRMKKLEQDLRNCQEKIVELMSQSEDFVKHQAYAERKENKRAEATYFGSYEHVDIHEEMIRDKPRTDAYRDALEALSKGKAVLDVGCGTGILSLFAARAGASRVVGVDASAIAEAAASIVKRNGMEEVVKVVKGQVEDLDESLGKFDVLVSEWMGYGLFFESMLDSVLVARDRYLDVGNGGVMVPSHASIFVQGLSYANSFWDDVYGFDFTHMKRFVPRDEMVMTIHPRDIITNRSCVKTFDLHKVTAKDLDFVEKFSIAVEVGERKLSGIVVSFDCQMMEGAVLSTAVGKSLMSSLFMC